MNCPEPDGKNHFLKSPIFSTLTSKPHLKHYTTTLKQLKPHCSFHAAQFQSFDEALIW